MVKFTAKFGEWKIVGKPLQDVKCFDTRHTGTLDMSMGRI